MDESITPTRLRPMSVSLRRQPRLRPMSLTILNLPRHLTAGRFFDNPLLSPSDSESETETEETAPFPDKDHPQSILNEGPRR